MRDLFWLLQRKGAWKSQMEKNVSSVYGGPFPWLILPKSKEPCERWKPSWWYAGRVWVYKGSGAGRPSLGEEILSPLKARHLEMNLLLRREQHVGPPPSGFWEKILRFSTHLVM